MSNIDELLPRRSEDGQFALDVFYLNYNDVNFYVEDADQENLYSEILKKLFPGKQFSRVFPLSGKSNVIQHANDPSNLKIERRIYLLDKDFDDLLGLKEDIDNLFYLDLFCIENYFIESDAIINLIIETYPKEKRDEIEKKLSISELEFYLYDKAKTLFSLFYFVQKEGLGIRNTSEVPEKFCFPEKLWEINEECILNYVDEINQKCSEKGCCLVSRKNPEKEERVSMFFSKSSAEVVSGKFILKQIFHYLKFVYGLGSITFDSFVFRLAKNCELISLKPLAEEIDKQLS